VGFLHLVSGVFRMIMVAVVVTAAMRVIVPVGVPGMIVRNRLIRCRASHFFLCRWFDLMPLKTL